MPTVTASSILTKAETLLQDTTHIRWPEAELLLWLNDGQREVGIARPDVCSRIVSAALVAGTKQTIPSDGTALIKVLRNMGSDGLTPGAAIRKVPMELLDSSTPNWHSATQVAAPQHFMTDVRAPKTYYVYPPANGTGKVELLYAAPPVEIPFLTSTGATYAQAATAVTVTQAGHGAAIGAWVYFAPSTGTSLAGAFQITAVTATTYTFTATTSLTTSGNCAASGVLNVDDVFAGPLVDYVCFRAYTKDNDLIGNKDRAMAHRQLFDGVMTSKATVDSAVLASTNNVAG